MIDRGVDFETAPELVHDTISYSLLIRAEHEFFIRDQVGGSICRRNQRIKSLIYIHIHGLLPVVNKKKNKKKIVAKGCD
jgi:hypothetical protein